MADIMSQHPPHRPDRRQPDRTRHPRVPPGEARPAVAVGVLLALACWALQAYGDPQLKAAGYTGWVAVVMVSAAAGSFVFHALHARARAPLSAASEAWALARRLIVRIGLSLCGSMLVLNSCLPA
jgi:hypothetical protein